jgi:hypothetical protein
MTCVRPRVRMFESGTGLLWSRRFGGPGNEQDSRNCLVVNFRSLSAQAAVCSLVNFSRMKGSLGNGFALMTRRARCWVALAVGADTNLIRCVGLRT